MTSLEPATDATTAEKKAIGWSAVLRRPSSHSNQHTDLSASTAAIRPLSGNSTRKNSNDAAALHAMAVAVANSGVPDERKVPNEAIFNTQFTTAGRKFLTKVKKNRAMQVDRRTRGFELGLEQRSVLINSITKRHYRVLIVDPDMQRREDLADALETFFEVLVAPSNDRAFALLSMFKADFVLLRVSFGHDHTIASSPTLAFLHGMKTKFVHTPVSVMVSALNGSSSNTSSSDSLHKLLQRVLDLGVCGYFEDGLPIATLVARLGKLLHALVIAQTELAQCDGLSVHAQSALGDDVVLPVQAIKKRGTAVHLVQHPATCKPDSVTYDQHRMLLELSLNQRKQCLLQRQALTEALDSKHSVLGVELSLAESASTGLIGLASPAVQQSADSAVSTLASAAPGSPGGGAFRPERRRLAKVIPPLPTQQSISRCIYAKPQILQGQIRSHLYETFHASTRAVVPQDPLLHHCIVIDPQTVDPTTATIAPAGGKRLLVTKAYLLYQEQRYDDALQLAARAIKMERNNVVQLAHLLRGALFDVSGQYVRAEREFRTALRLDPTLHEAHFNLSVSLLKMGRDADALAELSLALQRAPTNAQYVRNRALIYRRTGCFAQAQSEYAKLETLSGTTNGATSALRPPVAGSFANAASSAARLLEHVSGSTETPLLTSAAAIGTSSSRSSELDDGLFHHLFGQPADDKVALVCPPADRTPAMLASIVALLQTVLVFQDFPRPVLERVAAALEYEVVGVGKRFALSEDHPQSFYVVLAGSLSVRRTCGAFASSVTTHHLDCGMTFGCAGHAVSLSTQLIADASTEVGILWPDAYDATIRRYCTERNSAIFQFLQGLKAFQHFSTSELGHLIGISERKRFRKGETVLAQNDVPKYLCILWKGACRMYQDFDEPPLASDDDDDDNDSDGKHARAVDTDADAAPRVLPFHHLIAKPDWPLGFETSKARRGKSRKQVRGRRNALLSGIGTGSAYASRLYLKSAPSPSPSSSVPTQLKPDDKHALITTFVAPAIFGESAFREQDQQRSKCSIVADCIVEMLLFDHQRLQEMDLAPEVVREISDYAPKCLNERQVVKRQVEKESWSEYKNLRLLEVSKVRWPEAKTHLRLLSNGCSIMLAGRQVQHGANDD